MRTHPRLVIEHPNFRRALLAAILATAAAAAPAPATAELAARGAEDRADTLLTRNPLCVRAAARTGPEQPGHLVAWGYAADPEMGVRAYRTNGRPRQATQTTVRIGELERFPIVEDLASSPAGYRLIWHSDEARYRTAFWPDGSLASPARERLDRRERVVAAYALPDGRAVGVLAVGFGLVVAPRRGGFGDAATELARPGELIGTPFVQGRPDGGFVVAWIAATYPEVRETLRVRVHGPDGRPKGPAVEVAALTRQAESSLPALIWSEANCEVAPVLAVGADGRFALVWALVTTEGEPRPFLRFFAANGTPLGPARELAVTEDFGRPAAGALGPAGKLLLVSKSPFAAMLTGPGGDEEIVPVASETSADFPEVPSVDVVWNGREFVVAWVGAVFPDSPTPSAVFQRRFLAR